MSRPLLFVIGLILVGCGARSESNATGSESALPPDTAQSGKGPSGTGQASPAPLREATATESPRNDQLVTDPAAPTTAAPADGSTSPSGEDGRAAKTPDGETLVVESPEQRKARETAERKKAVNRLLEDMRDELRQDLGQTEQANPEPKASSPAPIPPPRGQPVPE